MDDYDPSSMDAAVAQKHILDSVQAIEDVETSAQGHGDRSPHRGG